MQQSIKVVSASNFVPNFDEFSLLQASRERNIHSLFVKVGGISTLAASEWRALSGEMNQAFPKATINRTVFNFATFDVLAAKAHEKLLPAMCGLEWRT